MNKLIKSALAVLALSVVYGIILRLFFGVSTWAELYSVMSVSFLFLMPTIMGILITYLSPHRLSSLWSYAVFMPWLSIVLLFVITLFFALEGWGCWIMAMPLFFVAGSLGGIIGRWLNNYEHHKTLKTSLIVILPLLLSPLEQLIGSIPAVYQADTAITINAPASIIWDEVTRVSAMKESDQTGFLTQFLDFPSPVRAELNYEGVGAYREAIFTKGLVFHETVLEYSDNQFMKFTIKADTYEIPSTTLDEHILIGGDYFDVLIGTYRIETISDQQCVLHLSSSFEMNTTFNFYAGLWGKFIMKDIQYNILRVEKRRAEAKYKSL